MAKLLALDYGGKRTGLAETDDLQIIASALTTVDTKELFKFLQQYLASNEVETLVVGMPVRQSGELSEIEEEIQEFIGKFQKSFSKINVERVNEAFTSQMAMQAMIQAGVSKKARRQKGNLDKISATIILQQYMESKRGGF